MYKLSQILIDHYEACCECYASIYRAYDEEKWAEKTDIIIRVKDMTARFMDNLMIDILNYFEHDVLKQLVTADIYLDDIYQLLCKTRDEAIEKFKKLERGLYNIRHATFELT
jgi:hypothetical protein